MSTVCFFVFCPIYLEALWATMLQPYTHLDLTDGDIDLSWPRLLCTWLSALLVTWP
jgi:hypothetical protein